MALIELDAMREVIAPWTKVPVIEPLLASILVVPLRRDSLFVSKGIRMVISPDFAEAVRSPRVLRPADHIFGTRLMSMSPLSVVKETL